MNQQLTLIAQERLRQEIPDLEAINQPPPQPEIPDEITAEDVPALLQAHIMNAAHNALETNLNRFTKLLLQAADEAAAARQMNEALLLQTIRRQAQATPGHFRQMFPIGPGERSNSAVHQFHEEWLSVSEKTTLRRLNKPLKEIQALLAGGPGGDGHHG